MDNEVNLMDEAQQMKDAQAQPHRFVWRFVYNQDKSLRSGRPIYDPVVFVEVISAEGEVRDVKYIKANELHKRKFPIAWKRFRENIAPEVDMGLYDPLTIEELREMYPDAFQKYKARVSKGNGGTLLCEWNQCPARLALELKYLGIFTVEDLLETQEQDLVPESLRFAAQQYIEAANNSARLNQLAQGMIKAKEIIDRQTREIAELKKQ